MYEDYCPAINQISCFPDNKTGLILIFTPKYGTRLILIYQKMKLQSKNYEILNKQKLRKKIYIYLPLTCFLFRNSLTTIYSRTIISSSSGMSCKSSVSKIAAEFSPFVFLPLSTRAYFKGRAYIKIILKNHARSYFAGRSYYRGNTVADHVVRERQHAAHRKRYISDPEVMKLHLLRCN